MKKMKITYIKIMVLAKSSGNEQSVLLLVDNES